MPLSFEFISRIELIPAPDWDKLAFEHSPLLQHSFLAALENSGSVGEQTGWQAQHLTIYQSHSLIGILPLYIKTHSYGEYVFDFAWAEAYERHGLSYYPKLVSAIPFTPVTGSRLMLAAHINLDEVLGPLCAALKARATALGLSSIHWLFVEEELSAPLHEQGLLQRKSVQFQWYNRGYQSFEGFLARFTSRKRKNVRKERSKVCDAGISVKRISGGDIRPEDMDFFFSCYQQTYMKRSGHGGYLTRQFFSQLLSTMRDHLLLVIASKDEQPVAAAFYLYDQQQLCGRYWGALEEFDGLHFECCYYQGIAFCIEQGIASFNPGTQGEHKIMRGFEPIYCYSNHYLAEPAFHQAVERFLEQERPQIAHYKLQAESLLPFKAQGTEDS
jgi:predicted N-acyltransferase